MELQVSSSTIVITGNIKSIADFKEIKSAIESMITNHKHININIADSLSITSSVIGYLNKLVLKDDIELRVVVGNEQLYNLLDDLNLVSTFKAKKSQYDN
jgi:hypothetical protein